MTKINTTGNNFSYLVFPLAATLSKFQQRRLGFLSAVFALQDNKFIFFKLSYFFRIWVCFCSQDINNFDNARGHYGEISPRQQPITARNFTVSNLCHIIIIIIIIIYIFIYIIIIILPCNNNIYHVIIIYIYIYIIIIIIIMTLPCHIQIVPNYTDELWNSETRVCRLYYIYIYNEIAFFTMVSSTASNNVS